MGNPSTEEVSDGVILPSFPPPPPPPSLDDVDELLGTATQTKNRRKLNIFEIRVLFLVKEHDVQ